MKMTADALKEIVRLHGMWSKNEAGGTRADLSGADLRRADLSEADLSGADLRRADLRGAYLSGADLSEADLGGTDLRGADLGGADLSRADLSGADLSGADLSGADLSGAYLSGIQIARCDWTGHGECGRTLIAMYLPARAAEGDKPAQEARTEYRCGCFVGTESALRQYISDGDEKHRKSRTIAVDFCAARIAEMVGGEG